MRNLKKEIKTDEFEKKESERDRKIDEFEVILLYLSLGYCYIDPESDISVVQMFVTLIQWRTDMLLAHFFHVLNYLLIRMSGL